MAGIDIYLPSLLITGILKLVCSILTQKSQKIKQYCCCIFRDIFFHHALLWTCQLIMSNQIHAPTSLEFDRVPPIIQ